MSSTSEISRERVRETMDEQGTLVSGSTAGSRANLYFTLARALEPPRNWTDETPGLFLGGFDGMGSPLDVLGERLASKARDLLEDRDPVAIAHAKLFLGPFQILAAPWASFYLEDDPRLMGPSSQYAAMAYADAGLAPSEKLRDAPDHVTHEMEFMYFLAFSEATTGDHEWADRQGRFWREHLGQWLPRFAQAVAQEKIHPFYNTLAEALATACALEEEELGPTQAGSVHGSEEPPSQS